MTRSLALILLLAACAPSYRHIQQPAGSNYCAAAVAAMITRTTMVDFYLFLEQEPGAVYIADLDAYLRHHGKHLEKSDVLYLPRSPAVVLGGWPDGTSHCVLWTGKRFHDPAHAEPIDALPDGFSAQEVWVVR